MSEKRYITFEDKEFEVFDGACETIRNGLEISTRVQRVRRGNNIIFNKSGIESLLLGRVVCIAKRVDTLFDDSGLVIFAACIGVSRVAVTIVEPMSIVMVCENNQEFTYKIGYLFSDRFTEADPSVNMQIEELDFDTLVSMSFFGEALNLNTP